MYRNKSGLIVWLIAACFLLSLLPALAGAESKQEIIEAAKKEGELSFYWSAAGSLQKEIIRRYEEKYPFIKVKLFKTDVFKMFARYQQEVLARRPTCDMLSSSAFDAYRQLYKEGNLLKYDSPEWDYLLDNLPKEYIQRGYYAPFRLGVVGSMINTKLVDPNTISSYDDMLQDRFKGLIAAGDVEHSSQAYPFYYALRKATGSTHYWKRLGELNAAVFTSSEKGSEACVSGEWPVIFDMWLYRGYMYGVLKKAPIKGFVAKEGGMIDPSPSVILKQARHPNAAKLMQDLMFSKEVQLYLTEKTGAHSARKDVPPPPGLPALNEMKLLPVDYDEAAKLKKTWMNEWKKLMNR